MYGNGNEMEPDIDGRNAAGYFVEWDYGSGGYKISESSDDSSSYTDDYEPPYLYKFASKEALVVSAVFQEMLGKALAHKDKTIRDLQNELLNREFS